MTDGVGPQGELEELFGGLNSAVQAEKQRRHGLDSESRQELDEFFGSLTLAVEAEVEAEQIRRDRLAARLERDLTGFFDLLEPTIVAATVAIEIMEQRAREDRDRQTAQQFSALGLVRTQELDLSRIFARILDPAGNHYQGDLFLSLLLEELNAAPGKHADLLRPFRPPGGLGSRVHLEYGTGEVEVSSGRKLSGSIDIVVTLEGNRWIGIENKPWADDQEEQIKRYLSALEEETAKGTHGGDIGQFLLLYWSGDGSSPKGVEDLSDAQRSQFLTLPYRRRFGVPSVEGWLRRCWLEGESDRVRVFLRDLLDYVQSQFSDLHPS